MFRIMVGGKGETSQRASAPRMAPVEKAAPTARAAEADARPSMPAFVWTGGNKLSFLGSAEMERRLGGLYQPSMHSLLCLERYVPLVWM